MNTGSFVADVVVYPKPPYTFLFFEFLIKIKISVAIPLLSLFFLPKINEIFYTCLHGDRHESP